VCAGTIFFFVLLYALATGIFAVFGRADDPNAIATLPGYVNEGLTAAMVIVLASCAITATLCVWYCLVCETIAPRSVQPLSPYEVAREPAAAAPAEADVAP
jgi:hypothetical protein